MKMHLMFSFQTKIGEFEKEWKLLNLFAYGKYRDFMGRLKHFA